MCKRPEKKEIIEIIWHFDYLIAKNIFSFFSLLITHFFTLQFSSSPQVGERERERERERDEMR
jgi:hypothetical protein